MKQKRTFVTLLLVIAILCLGIAYAAISSVNLTITGNVSAIAAEGTVEVEFTDAKVETTSKGIVTAEPYTEVTEGESTKQDYTKATINVSELKAAGEKAIVKYTIENKAEDVAATLADPTITWDNKEWFNVTCTLSGKTLDKNSDQITTDTQTATVEVELLKTPVSTADQTAATDEITITINAAPVENKVPQN